jgi:hypothetical protein
MFSSRILLEKRNANLPVLFSCFLWFQEQSLSRCHSQKDPGYGKKFIPDPGGKKAPDPDPQHLRLWTSFFLDYTFTNMFFDVFLVSVLHNLRHS